MAMNDLGLGHLLAQAGEIGREEYEKNPPVF
jgi:hypothetical protein